MIEKKIINNAISAYFGLGALLLIPTKKEYINHPFVKNHAKTALFIHILFLITYVIFIGFSFGHTIIIYGVYLHNILASSIFILLFLGLLYGSYKASLGEKFGIGDMVSLTKSDQLYEVKKSQLNEKGILTIILSLIPFIGFIIRGKYEKYKSPIIENNVKCNFLITFGIVITFISGYKNVGVIFILFYIIAIVFYSMLMIVNKNIIILKVGFIPTMENLYIYTISFFKYLKGYFQKNSFMPLSEIIQETFDIYEEQKQKRNIFFDILPHPKIAHKICYIPIINIFSLIDIKSKYYNHIINGLIITFLSIILYLKFPPQYQLLILFLIFFGIGKTQNLGYQFPFLFQIYEIVIKFLGKLYFFGKKAKEKHNEVEEISYKRKTKPESKIENKFNGIVSECFQKEQKEKEFSSSTLEKFK